MIDIRQGKNRDFPFRHVAGVADLPALKGPSLDAPEIPVTYVDDFLTGSSSWFYQGGKRFYLTKPLTPYYVAITAEQSGSAIEETASAGWTITLRGIGGNRGEGGIVK